MEKTLARSKGLKARDSMDTSAARDASGVIVGKFLEEFLRFNSFLCYFSIRSEVYTALLIEELYRINRTVYLPIVKGDEIFTGLYKGNESLIRGAFGVREPAECANTEFIDVAVVPGTAFDRRLNRVGYGRGYYDRLLKKSRTGIIVGFAFECQVVDNICAEPHDVSVDLLITEKYIYRRNS